MGTAIKLAVSNVIATGASSVEPVAVATIVLETKSVVFESGDSRLMTVPPTGSTFSDESAVSKKFSSLIVTNSFTKAFRSARLKNSSIFAGFNEFCCPSLFSILASRNEDVGPFSFKLKGSLFSAVTRCKMVEIANFVSSLPASAKAKSASLVCSAVILGVRLFSCSAFSASTEIKVKRSPKLPSKEFLSPFPSP